MKSFGGPAIFLDRDDINTDEIIPAKYLTEITKAALKPHLLEDLLLEGFSPQSDSLRNANVVITRGNFGCGSSREHAVWVFEVNDINVVIGESFARIFRQNMFNCGILAMELPKADIEEIFNMIGNIQVDVDIQAGKVRAISDNTDQADLELNFELNLFDKDLVAAGGWLTYAESKY